MSYFHLSPGKHRPAEGRWVVYRTAVRTSLEHPGAVTALRRADRRLWLRRAKCDAALGVLFGTLVVVLALTAIALGAGT